MKHVIVALLFAVGVNGLARGQEATPIYFDVRIKNNAETYSNSSLKGVVLRAIEENISSRDIFGRRFVRSYNEDELNAFVVSLSATGLKRGTTTVGVVFVVEARVENYMYTKLFPLIRAESSSMGFDPDAYDMDFIRSGVDEVVLGTMLLSDLMWEEYMRVLNESNNQQEEGN